MLNGNTEMCQYFDSILDSHAVDIQLDNLLF